jgi:hypothetical protein
MCIDDYFSQLVIIMTESKYKISEKTNSGLDYLDCLDREQLIELAKKNQELERNNSFLKFFYELEVNKNKSTDEEIKELKERTSLSIENLRRLKQPVVVAVLPIIVSMLMFNALQIVTMWWLFG